LQTELYIYATHTDKAPQFYKRNTDILQFLYITGSIAQHRYKVLTQRQLSDLLAEGPTTLLTTIWLGAGEIDQKRLVIVVIVVIIERIEAQEGVVELGLFQISI